MDTDRNRESILRIVVLVALGTAIGCSCSRPPGPVEPRPSADAGVAAEDAGTPLPPVDAGAAPEVVAVEDAGAPPPEDAEQTELVQGTDENPVRIFFDEDKSDVPPIAQSLLDAVAERLRLRPSEVVRLVAHSDGLERLGRAMEISGERAQAIVNYMAQRGVQRERFIIDARGAFEPEGDLATDQGRAENRRVDFVFERGFGP
ncbi:MAG: OmpA family protein [Deltaproteobacteria bacterium]|nr:OmpA family protein [Deltaproteobacteria bacterium]